MALLRRVIGETLRGQRLRQQRTLREVSTSARVSLGYLSEVERGQKEASSELLGSICDALDLPLSEVLREASDALRDAEVGVESAVVTRVSAGRRSIAVRPMTKVVIPQPRAGAEPRAVAVGV